LLYLPISNNVNGTIKPTVEEAGGKCLPCIVDIRYEDQVSKAVEQAVQKFGGIDILVNNASAINLTDTLATDMKRYIRIWIIICA